MADDFKSEIRSRAGGGPVDMAISRLKDWGATSINAIDVGGNVAIDFNTPFPGNQPIHSSITLDGNEVVEATIRYGVLDKNALGGTPEPIVFDDEPQPEAIARLQRAVNVPVYPGSLRVGVDFGDADRQPRPHVNVGVTRGAEVHGAVPGQSTPMLDFLNWMIEVGEQIREEFDAEFVETVPGLPNAPRFIAEFADRVSSQWEVESANPSSITNTEVTLTKSLAEATVEFDAEGGVVRFSATFETTPFDPQAQSDEEWQETVESVDLPEDTTAFVTDRTGKREVNWDSARAGEMASAEQVASGLTSLALRA